jgi:hypothetical protein
MNWNTIPNEERLRLWKKLRHDIESLPCEERLNKIAEFCAYVPIGSRSVDYYDPQSWPSPWEILFNGSFCTSSTSILIFYTLELITPPTPIELWLVEDDDDIFLLPVIDNQYVLNYELGKVNRYPEIQDRFKVLLKYTKAQIKTIT